MRSKKPSTSYVLIILHLIMSSGPKRPIKHSFVRSAIINILFVYLSMEHCATHIKEDCSTFMIILA